jgi:hypothetical protein
VASPSPDAPPVMTATLPAISMRAIFPYVVVRFAPAAVAIWLSSSRAMRKDIADSFASGHR